MSLIFQSNSDLLIPGTPAYKDELNKLFGAKTKAIFDSQDPYSWDKQAAPAGGDVWTDLSTSEANASMHTTPPSAWAGGGFVFADSAAAQRIILPEGFKPASTSKGFAVSYALKYTTPAGGNKRVGGWHYNFSGAWGHWDNAPNQALLIADGGTLTLNGLVTGATYFITLGRFEDGAGGYKRGFRIYNADGLYHSSDQASGATAAQPSSPPANATFGLDSSSGLGGVLGHSIYQAMAVDAGTDAGVMTLAKFNAQAAAHWNSLKHRIGTDWA